MRLLSCICAVALLTLSFTTLSAQDERGLSPFTEIVVTGNFKVNLVPSDRYHASVSTLNTSEDKISIRVKDEVLRISVNEGIIYRNDQINITVEYNKLYRIKAIAGAEIYSDEPINTGDVLAIKVGSGAVSALEVNVDGLKVNVTEGGELDLKGIVRKQEVAVATGGQYDGVFLECQKAKVKANTGGVAKVVAREMLDANASTGGEIKYIGEPATKEIRSLFSGGIRRVG